MWYLLTIIGLVCLYQAAYAVHSLRNKKSRQALAQLLPFFALLLSAVTAVHLYLPPS